MRALYLSEGARAKNLYNLEAISNVVSYKWLVVVILIAEILLVLSNTEAYFAEMRLVTNVKDVLVFLDLNLLEIC